MRNISALMAFVLPLCASGAAIAQTSPSQNKTALPERTALSDAAGRGYTAISHMRLDGKGDWMGDSKQGEFEVTPKGKVLSLR